MPPKKKTKKQNPQQEVWTDKALEGDVILLYGRKCVVIKAGWGGGGTGHGPHDIYPDAWQVRVRLLDDRGRYDPKGIVHEFNQLTNCYSNTINKVQVVGKMVQTWIPA